MENVLFYFLKVNGLLLVFYFAYYLFLRKETFFQSNRLFLLLGIVSSFIFPLISFTNVIWIEPEPIIQSTATYNPIRNFQVVPTKEPFNWNKLLFSCYTIVSFFFLAKLSIEITSFFKIIKNGKKSKADNIVLVETNESQNPFSFFNYLVFNQSHFTAEELNMILIHEKVHIQQKHSFDVLIGKLLCLLFWINPIVWFYRKAMLENLEFIADYKTATLTNNSYIYQKTLLKAVVCNHQLTITNQFYQSLIKKRIVMLNTNPSRRKKLWKYSLVVPFLVAFVLLFQIETIAQIKNKSKIEKQTSRERIELVIDKNTSDKDIKEETEMIKQKYDVSVKVSKIKRNAKNEIIALKIEYKDDNGSSGSSQINSDEAIDPIVFYLNNLNGNKSMGFKTLSNNEEKNKAYVYHYEEDSDEDEVSITSYSFDDLPEPPTPPSHPYENLREAPTPPDFPDAPSAPSNFEDENEMKKFEEKMAVFEMKMKKMEPQIKKFEKEVEVFEMEIEGFEPDMKAFEKQMEEFEKKMEIYQEKLMQKLQKENEFQEKNKERIIERKVVVNKRKDAIEAEKMAMKAQMEAQKEAMKSQMEAQKEAMKNQMEAQKEAMKGQMEAQKQKMKAEIEKQKAEERRRIEQSKKE
ncbi:MAG TPA: M56 family metallopeptidase [Flavobacterium sp.]|nr:M56 family metallopeptidase [Flavobacterium sp.]